MLRETQIQVRVTQQEKERFAAGARKYNLKLAAFARLSMAYVLKNQPALEIDPNEEEEEEECPMAA